MASHQLAIAKASFTASMLRPDPISVSRDEISHFHASVNSVACQCSPVNIQNCKRWLLANVIQSAARFTALGKYLIALSTSFSGPAKPLASITSRREPSGKRKRLHLLYLINDLLYHAKFHANDASVASKVQLLLVGLLSSAASFRNSPKHHRKIEELLDIWENKNYYLPDYIERLREAVRIARDAEQSSEATQPDQNGGIHTESKPQKRTPFVMPAIHGDQGTPWYDLPAGNLMPHITPKSTRPINPTLVKALRFVAGPADEDLASAVKNLLQEVNSIFGNTQFQDQYETVSWDINELGQEIIHDDVAGEALSYEGYYGWSKRFCEKMKRRRKGLEHARMEGHNERQRRSRSRSRSQSSSLSSQRHKRRRFSNSEDERSNTSRSRYGRRDYSSSRSRSRDRSIPLQRNKRSSASHESISRSTSQERNGRDVISAAYASQPHSLGVLPDVVREPFGQNNQSIAALQQAFLHPSSHNFSSGVIQIPPPPPQQYGQWPPQPLLPPSTTPYAQQAHLAGSWPAQPPPFHQHWSAASFGQMPPGPVQQGGNGRGTYGGRGGGGGGGGGGAGHSQQHHPGVVSGYNGYRGSGRGNNG